MTPSRATSADYEWLANAALGCYHLLVVDGMPHDAVVDAFGGVAADVGPMTPVDACELMWDPRPGDRWRAFPLIQVEAHQDSVVVFASWQLIDVDELSGKGVSVVDFFYSEDAAGVSLRVPGRESRRVGYSGYIHDPLPDLEGLGLDEFPLITEPAGWALVERWSGVHLSEQWLTNAHPTFRINQGTVTKFV